MNIFSDHPSFERQPFDESSTVQSTSGETSQDDTVDMHLHEVASDAPKLTEDPETAHERNPDLPQFQAAQMIFSDYPNESKEYGNPVLQEYLGKEEGHAQDTYETILDVHDQVVEALEDLTDPSILAEKYVWSNGQYLGIPIRHRALEIEILNAMSEGDAQTVFGLTAEIQENFRKADETGEVERYLRYFTGQALAFFTQILLNLGISVDLAFFLFDFFNKQVNGLRSVNSLLAYQNQMLQVYITQVRKHHERNFSPTVQRAVNFIRQNTKKSLSLETIAKHADVHPNYLSQKFSQEVGVTLSQFIVKERMSSIKSYLVETDLPLADIAKRFNFSSSSYFSTYFRKHTGVSPSRYRKDHRKF